MISNVAVVTECERLSKREGQDREQLREEQSREKHLQQAAADSRRIVERAAAKLAVRRRRVEAMLAAGRIEGRQLGRAALEQQQAIHEMEASGKARQKAEKKAQENQDRQRRLEKQIKEAREQQVKLEPQKLIRQLDPALDSILTATKLAAMMLITFVLREYLTVEAMNPQTFVSRILTMSGRKELRAGEERVIFYENPRDPEINQALRVACRRLNRRKLQREGRRLLYEVSPPRDLHQLGQFG
jgi:Fe2+ transport system protein B